jgi:DNA topoisomerase-2
MKTSKSAKNVPVESAKLGPQVEDYQQLDPRTHVYEKPGMWIGSIELLPRDEWLYDVDKKTMYIENIDVVPAVERLLLEILSNAADNCEKSRRAGVDCGQIEMTMDKKRITMKNYGLPIPIDIHPQTKKYVPEMIFGVLLSGSNLNKNVVRHGVGTFGVGSKATNIFSLRFEVTIENHIMKKRYNQVWENNMIIRHEYDIKPYTGKTSSVFISYDLDFKVFGYTEYPDAAFDLFRRHVIDISFNSKIPVMFNDEYYDYSDPKDYARLYFGDDVDKCVSHIQYDEDHNVNLELYVFDTPDEGNHISFVNCMMTRKGGVHHDVVFKALCTPIVHFVNNKTAKKNDKNDKEKKPHIITLNDVKQHISILLSCKLPDPDFTGQCKEFLNKPTPKIQIPNDVLKPMYDWDLINRLYATLNAKYASELTKTDGKMCKYVDIKKGKDAEWAGTNKRDQCILLLSEGKSASAYLKHYRSHIPNGTNIYGNLPLKGKCLNTMKAEDKRIAKNEEIIILKKMLGLKEDVDYTDPSHFKTLRYGRVMICADSDADGKHIIGLILNIFYSRFPSLIKVPGFLTYKRTPIMKAFKGKMTRKFYTPREYEAWCKKNQVGWKIKWYKGLATSTQKDVIEDIEDEHIVTLQNDNDVNDAMQLAFHADQKYRDDRKDWILNWIERTDVDSMVNQPISLFINHEFILFSKLNLIRALPKYMDGYKQSQRKIMCGAHKYFNIGPINKQYEEERLGILDGYIISKVGYHHGDGILSDAIVKMAQNFVGTNNINVFEPEGQFGTRDGKDSGASRYLNTYPSKIVPYIFHIDDQPLLQYMEDENKTIEPLIYHQVIPLVLCNGCCGIGTGWSTYCPPHNPLDVINWLKLRLTGSVNLPSLMPWYRGFEGTITIIDRRQIKKVKYNNKISKELIDDLDSEPVFDHAEDEESNDDELSEKNFKERPLLSFVITGNYYIQNNGDIIITELPIGLSPEKYYRKRLLAMRESKKIKDVLDHCTVDKIKFILKGYVGNPSYKNLFLRRRYSLTNMILLDNNDKPIRFETANDIIEAFYNNRIVTYGDRKKYKLDYIQNQINKLSIQIKFINAVKNKTILIEDTIENIYAKLDQLHIPHEIYDQARIKIINKGETTTLQNNIDQYQKEYDHLEKVSPAEIWLNDLKQLETAYRKIYKQ